MISKNTGKSPGDLRIHVVIQTPVEDHQLTLVGKTLNIYNNNNNNKMKGTLIPIVIGAFGTVPKGLEREMDKLEIEG